MRNLDTIRKGSCVLVKWHDAQMVAQWTKQEDFVGQPLPEIATVGIWVGTTPTTVCVAHSVSDDDDCDGMRIPKAWVTSIKILQKGKG